MHLLLISDKRRDKITTTTQATRGASMLKQRQQSTARSELLLITESDLANGIFNYSCYTSDEILLSFVSRSRLTISLLMCKIYRSILFICGFSPTFFWSIIVVAPPKLFSSSSITDGHWLTTYTLLTIVSLSCACNYCCIIYFFLFYSLHLLNACFVAIAHLFAYFFFNIHENLFSI